MSNRVLSTVMTGSLLLAMAASAAWAAAAAKRPPVDLKEKVVFQLVDAKESDTLRISGGGGGMTTKDHNYMVSAKAVATGEGKTIALVTGKDSPTAKLVTGMRPGEYFTATLEHKGSNPYDFASTFALYPLQPGEDRPNVYLFAESSIEKKDGNDVTVVKLYKLGRFASINIPNAKDASGKLAPDPKILEAVGKLAKGDSVEITSLGDGPAQTLRTIEPYALPKEAVFSKATESDVEGGKTPAIEVTVDGKALVLLVPGKAAAAGKWTPDSALAASVRNYKDGDKVIVRFRTEGDRNWLKEITRAPKT